MNEEPASRLSSFAVVVPMFNEESGAERCVQTIDAALAGMPRRTRLIVVDAAPMAFAPSGPRC